MQRPTLEISGARMSESKIDKRKSPEFAEHLKKVGFQKGHPKYGGRKKLDEDLRLAMAEKSFDAFETMVELMETSTNPAVRFKAAEYVLSPFVQRAPIEVKHEHKHEIADLLSRVNQKRLKGDKEPILIDLPASDYSEDDEGND